MAQVCSGCGKGPQFGNNVSHANNKTRRRWNVNLHPVKAKVAGHHEHQEGSRLLELSARRQSHQGLSSAEHAGASRMRGMTLRAKPRE